MRFRRIIASIIDLALLLFTFSAVIGIFPLTNETRNNYNKIDEIEKKSELTADEEKELNKLYYEIEHENVKYYLMFSVILIIYLIIIPKYRKDQTIGQRIMKIRLVSDSTITMNTYVIRAVLNSGISIFLISSLMLYILNIVWYSMLASILILFQITYWFISFIMLLISNQTLHDRITRTKIIEVKR